MAEFDGAPALELAADDPFEIGTCARLVHRTSTLSANTVLTEVLVGTPVVGAIPADTLIVSNICDDGDIVFVTATGGNSIEVMRIDGSASLVTFSGNVSVGDDESYILGNDSDIVLHMRSTSLAANTTLTGVIVGTPTSINALHANSLIVSNITEDGDIIFLTTTNGNSRELMRFDAIFSRVFLPDPGGLIIGHNEPINGPDTSELQVLGTSGPDASIIIGRWNTAQGRGHITFIHSINSSIGSNTISSDDHYIGGFVFCPDDGAVFTIEAATHFVEVDDATPEASFIGAAFVWNQMAGGNGNNIRETMRLPATGILELVFGGRVADDVFWAFGTNSDSVILNRSTSLSADTELTNVIEGTSDHQGVAANSLIVSNITNDGDMMFLVSDGGDSKEFLLADADVAFLHLGFGMTNTNIYASGDITIAASAGSLNVTLNDDDADSFDLSNSASSYYLVSTINTVEDTIVHLFDTEDATFAATASSIYTLATFNAYTLTLTGTTQVTSLIPTVAILGMTITDASAVTVDKVTSLQVVAPTEAGSVTLTNASAIRILNAGGTPTTQAGIYIEDLTVGATNDYGIYIEGADTAAIWVNSADPIHVGLAGTATGVMEWSGATSGTVTLTVAAAAGTWTMTLPTAVGTSGQVLTDAAGDGVTSWTTISGGGDVNDDVLRKFGTDGDGVIVLNSAGLAANTELTGVIVGTSVYANAIPANSLIVSNITADGDIVFFGQTGGNSIEVMRIDASARSLVLEELDDAATPTLAFGNGNTGFFRSAANTLNFVSNGSARFELVGGSFQSNNGQGPRLQNSTASATFPTLIPDQGDENTGIGQAGTDQLSLIAGGIEIMRMVEGTTDYALAPLGIRFGADSSDNLIDDASTGAASTQLFIGNASIDVTSDERVKSDILPWESSGLGLLSQLTVKEYAYASHVPFGNVYDGKYIGVTAQDVYKVAPWAVNTQGGAECWKCLTGVQCDDHVNPWTVKADLLVGLIVKSIQELEQENADLRERVAILEEK